MAKERSSVYVACEEVDMIWDEKDVLAFDVMWNQGLDIFVIADAFDRDPDEVVLLVLDRARKGHIQTKHPGGEESDETRYPANA